MDKPWGVETDLFSGSLKVNGVVADMGLGPLILPLHGGVYLAGVFLSLAFVTGGLWLLRRYQDKPTAYSGSYFALALGGAACSIAFALGAVALLEGPAILATAAPLLFAGVYLIVRGWRRPLQPVTTRPAAPTPARPGDTTPLPDPALDPP
jgi:hypothetical protein